MATPELNRRNFVSGTVATAAWFAGLRETSILFAGEDNEPQNLYWGDLHNHNECGLAKGSLGRAIDLARGHLDFWAATGHAHWHDMPDLPGKGNQMFLEGFERHRKHWDKTRSMVRDATDEKFVAILGYEWHSSFFGDYCMLFPEDNKELYLPDHANKLLDYAESHQALAIPHHVAYKQGWRGANFKYHRYKTTSPVVEVMSEHGCTMTHTSPHDFIRHSMGGRATSQVIEHQLAQGKRFGFVGSSDTHRGYPGAYGEGVVAVWAPELSQQAIFRAIRNRHTYATTGERISLEFAINGKPMGSELAATADRQIDVRVEAQDSIQMVELVRNGTVIERTFPADTTSPPQLPGRAKCRVRYGWGPWKQFELGRVCQWDMDIELKGGTIRRAIPCFQAAPFSEELRDKLTVKGKNSLRLVSPTTRVQAFSEDPTKSVILDLEGGPEATVVVRLRKPVEQTVTARLSHLVHDNVVTFTGGFTSESYVVEKLVGPSEYAAKLSVTDRRKSGIGPDWYYVRVTQHNGHCAWSSPIWVG